MSLSDIQKAYLNNYATTLRDSADKEYIAARSMFKLELDNQFYWHAQQALEKYLKAILLFNEIKIKKQGHDLSKLYHRMVVSLNLKEDNEVMDYLEDMEFIGLNRYDVREKYSVDFSLLVLDKLVYFFRRFCKSVLNIRQQHSFKIIRFDDKYKKIILPFGYLEKVMKEKEKYKSQREMLIWKYFYFGKQIKKTIRNYKFKRTGGSSILLRHKDAYLILKKYVYISKKDEKFFDAYYSIGISS